MPLFLPWLVSWDALGDAISIGHDSDGDGVLGIQFMLLVVSLPFCAYSALASTLTCYLPTVFANHPLETFPCLFPF